MSLQKWCCVSSDILQKHGVVSLYRSGVVSLYRSGVVSHKIFYISGFVSRQIFYRSRIVSHQKLFTNTKLELTKVQVLCASIFDHMLISHTVII